MARSLFSNFRQGCQFGFFEAKFVIFGLFLTPLAFFIFEKRPNQIWLFWPVWLIRFCVDLADLMMILADFYTLFLDTE